MREKMQDRLQAAESDRKTICQFLNWVAKHQGKLTLVLPSGTNQAIDFNDALDEFHGIDRVRLAAEDKLYGKGSRDG